MQTWNIFLIHNVWPWLSSHKGKGLNPEYMSLSDGVQEFKRYNNFPPLDP